MTPEVKAASDYVLVMTFAALTHRLHEADRKKEQDELALRIRIQRDEVQEEILKRMRKE